MGINLTLYTVAIGEENMYFLTPHYRFIKRDWIDDNDFLSTNENSFCAFDYHVLYCGKNSFRNSRRYKVHSNYD